jgi:hydroxyethylthiazole kinase-like uncharacterized protein yjeF
MLELLTTAEMAEADRLTIAGGVRGIDLMENAGRAVANVVAARHPPGSRILVVAGPGNNGGDGFVAARELAQRGDRVRVVLVGDPKKLKGDAESAAARWQGTTETGALQATHEDIIIDALFGAGLDRPVEGLARQTIEAMNTSGLPVVAVDLPSGINGTTGAAMGVAVRASDTVTFFRRKPGHVLLPGRDYCGRVHIADIGIKAEVLDRVRPRGFVNERQLWCAHFPLPRAEGHKYSRGHAVVVSGGAVTTGAGGRGGRGALRAGGGRVTIASPREALAIQAAANTAVMVRPVDGAGELKGFLGDSRFNAVVLGPGGGVGPALCAQVQAALDGPRAVVLDADALTSFAADPAPLFSAIAARSHPVVLTPHTGEFARLFGSIAKASEKQSKLEKAAAAARVSGAVVLLKGADTVVAHPDGRAAVNCNAPPWLATAGTGDVLAGFIAGLLAQGMPAFEAACAAAWLHGEAAAAAGPGLISEDLPDALPTVYRHLFDQLKCGVRP